MLLMKLVSNLMTRGFPAGALSLPAAFSESASLTNLGDVRSFGKLFTDRWSALSFKCALQTCLSSSVIFAFTTRLPSEF